MRLDKLISQSGFGSRKDCKSILKQGIVSVNNEIITSPSFKINTEQDTIFVGDTKIEYEKYVYIMMNKPEGVVCATYDEEASTIVDLLNEKDQWFDLFPVGRLDKDTTGLVILTNDGIFAHRALSPKKHVEKVYIAEVVGEILKSDIVAFEKGIVLDDGYKTMPAQLSIVCIKEKLTEVMVIIKEGKFHQIKRMFSTLNKDVYSLKRTVFAGIELDGLLEPCEYRRLNKNEMDKISNLISKD